MSGKFKEIDLSKTKTVSIEERGSKVSVEDFGRPMKGMKFFSKWLDSLPDQLAAKELRTFLEAMKKSRSIKGNEIIWMLGAHVIKCGLSPYIIELIKDGFVTTIATNGAGLIHDTEIAAFGRTSEDVKKNLENGTFGFSRETADLCFEAVERGYRENLGLGETLGRFLNIKDVPYKDKSILSEAYRLDVPVTVHIAVGTDIINQHQNYRGDYWGKLSMIDFKIFADRVRNLGEGGGVVINAGSAVILPEVFLKALSIARNLKAKFDNITACNLDMIRHYRPETNVLHRPSSFGGKAISITGHHEIMIPIIYAGLNV